MSYFAAILWYMSWLVTVAIAYFASEFAIKHFDKKWKKDTESEESSQEQEISSDSA